MRNATYVLGTNLSHDGSACILKDGRLLVAIEKERLTRRKHDGLNDTEVINYCLEATGLKISDLSLIVQNTWNGMFERGNQWFYGPRVLDPRVPIVTISHHLAHAYGAFAMSPFDEAAVLVVDNGGNSLDECGDLSGAIVPVAPKKELRPLYCEVDSFYHFGPTGVRTLFKEFSPPGLRRKPYPMLPGAMMHSIGGVYGSVSHYVFGYGSGMDDSGKLMGLAPYGKPGTYDMPIFDLRKGRVSVRYDWQHHFNDPCRDFDQFNRQFQYYADIAYWAQDEIQRAIRYLVKSRRRLSPSRRLCYAGGVALNAVANRRILTDGYFDDVFILPAAGDNGVALGCAFYGWLEVLRRERVMHDGPIYFGASYDTAITDAAISSHGLEGLLTKTDDYLAETARLLAAGKVVAWFQRGAEFGPRALGNRSILADPRLPGIRDFINREIKNREDFRPFAPSVLQEDAAKYFECSYDSPYMILVAPVRPEWRETLSSVVHCDASARLQTVTAESNPEYYKLLRAFKEVTGIGVLLNTSLNKRGQPIVETPAEASELFASSRLDALVIDGRILCKGAREQVAPQVDLVSCP